MKTAPLFSLLVLLGFLPAGETRAQPAPALAPTWRDVAYDDGDEAQVLDVYLAKSDTPTPAMIYLHGGGWRAGTKNRIPAFLARGVADGSWSVVSVEYRFTDVAPHPAQVHDCVRAIQFARSRAEEWNLDPARFGVTGGSAGAHLSLWIALHDDFANPDAEDPVERESSRVSCAIGFAGPTNWDLLSEIRHDHPAYRQLLGYDPGTPAGEMDAAKKASVSPITHVSRDDPPVLIVHGDADVVVPVQHARDLHERMTEAGARSELFLVPGGNHGVAGGAEPESVKRAVAFLAEHLVEPEKLAEPRAKTEVLIVVGPEKHAPGTHEVAAGGRVIAHCLETASNLDGVTARVLYQWPADDALLDAASTVVFIGDQFPAERLEQSDEAMADLERMMRRGCGIVCVHYATGLGAGDVSPEGDHPLLAWTGGYFATRCDHHQSVARIVETTITPAAPADHPIRRGWEAFEIRDEPYTRIWFGRDGLAEGALSLATVEAPAPGADPGETGTTTTETVAWAVERPDGGRGAGITMPHFFRNWEREELRRFILNTIAWTAQLEVPAGGVATTLPDLESFAPVSVDPQPRAALPKPPARQAAPPKAAER